MSRLWTDLIHRLRSKAAPSLLTLAMISGILLLCLPACSTIGTLSLGNRYLFGGTRENIVTYASPE